MEESNQKQNQDQEPKTQMLDEKVENWSEHVEDLRDSGDTDGAISFLELVISRLDDGSSTSTGDLQLAAAMGDLADLYSLRGYTIKSDELRSRAFSLRSRINQESLTTPIVSANSRVAQPTATISVREKGTEGSNNEEDWEALADKEETEINLLSEKPKAETSLAEFGNLEHKEKDKIQEECEEANDLRLDSLSITEGENEGNPGPITSGDYNQLLQYTEVINSENKVFRQLLLGCNRFIQTATPSTPEQLFDDYLEKLKVIMLSHDEQRKPNMESMGINSMSTGPSSSHQMTQPPEMILQQQSNEEPNMPGLGQYNDEPNFDKSH